MRSRFKDFLIYGNRTICNEVNLWLEQNPYIRIIKWSAAPCINYGTRLIIEFEDLSSSSQYASANVAGRYDTDTTSDWGDR